MTDELDPAAAMVLGFLKAEAEKRGPPAADPHQRVLDTRIGYRGLIPAGGTPEAVAEVSHVQIPGPGGAVSARLYRPENASRGALLYLHGGGFCVGDLDTHDTAVRALANRSLRTILSLDYRLAPEHPYPAAVEDALAGLDWLVENAKRLGVDPGRIAVAGDSAGGELSLALAVANRDRGGPPIERMALLYPMGDMSPGRAERWPSIRQHEGKILTEAGMDDYIAFYLGGADPMTAQLSPAVAGNLSRLPPAIVVTCGHDPLRDEGEALARRLAQAGVTTEHWPYHQQIHAFFQLGGFVPEGNALMDRLGAALRTG